MASKNEKKRSFVMYDSFLEAMKHLTDKEFRECVNKIRDYALEGIDDESISPNVNIIMTLAKPNLDSARRRYMACVENGKKGAEFGKDGGAPKGNQNASKDKQPQNQPLKQPLDVDDNVNVDADVNEDGNVEVEVNADGIQGTQSPSPTTISKGLNSYSGLSMTHHIREIENDSERLEDDEHQSLLSVFHSNDTGGYTAHSIPSHKTSATSTCSRREVKGGEYSMGDYMRMCLKNYTLDLADMRKGRLPQDDGLFWKAVDTYKSLYGIDEDKAAIMAINSRVEAAMRQGD